METEGKTFTPGNLDGEERICIEFPTELIADEYQHENGSTGLVYALCEKSGQQMAKAILDSLQEHGYNIPTENQFDISDSEEVLTNIATLAEGDYSGKSCLIVLLIATADIYKQLLSRSNTPKLWSPFIGNGSLKYRPKIFIFLEYKEKKEIMTDTAKFSKVEPYDVPSEADVLIIYQKTNDNNINKKEPDFLEEFCHNIRHYGERDDIMDILIRSKCKFRPLIISTLRKKFYISSSSFREHYFDIQKYNEEVLKKLHTLNNRVQNLTQRPSRRIGSPNSSTVTPDKTITSMQRSQENQKNSLIVADGVNKRKTTSSLNMSNKEKQPVKPAWRF